MFLSRTQVIHDIIIVLLYSKDGRIYILWGVLLVFLGMGTVGLWLALLPHSTKGFHVLAVCVWLFFRHSNLQAQS